MTSFVADASASTDNDSTPIATYSFDFGDGTALVGPQAGATASHTYSTPGVYTVTMTVKDEANNSSQATATVTVASSNLVTNSGFEQNTNGWAASGSGVSISRVTSPVHTGTGALSVTDTNTKGKQTCGFDDSPNVVSTTSAATYTAQLWVRADQAGTSFTLQLGEIQGSRTLGSASKVVTLTTSWQQVSVSYLIKKPGSTLSFTGSTSQKAGLCFYADDASLTYV